MVLANIALTEEMEEENNRWIQVHFSALNVPGCQTKWQWNGLHNNRRYRKNTYACEETDHHSHWYCTECFRCANLRGNYIPTPTENSVCLCNEDEYYAEYINMTSSDNDAEDEPQPEQLEDSNELEFNFSDEDSEYILNGKG